MSTTRKLRQIAGILTAAAGAIYLLAETVAAAAFKPSYSYARNYISDLGVARCGQPVGEGAFCSPLHAVMNAGFAIEGVVFLAGALVVAATLASWIRWVFVALVAVHAVGGLLIASFSEATLQGDAGAQWHLLGAAFAIIGGNAAVLASAPLGKAMGLPPLVRAISIVLPPLGVFALTMLVLARAHGGTSFLQDGTWERISVYTITAWQILAGVALWSASARTAGRRA